MFKKRVEVSNIKKPELSFEEDFRVDIGALCSFIPEDYLERIEVEPSAMRNPVLVDGRRKARLFGFCHFLIEGLENSIACTAIFAPERIAVAYRGSGSEIGEPVCLGSCMV